MGALVVLVGLVLAGCTRGAGPDDSTEVAASPAKQDVRPNIVLITTDDQTRPDLDHMPLTRRLLGEQGLELTDFLSPHPLCCPARAEIFTGEYAHNNGVRHNSGPYGGYAAFSKAGHREENLGTWLQRAGYRTAFVGKMLNGYQPRHDPPPRGWDVWRPSARGTYAYVDTEFLYDGARPRRESSYRVARGYVTDRVADYATDLVERLGGKKAPFFLWVSHVAPHVAMTGDGTGPPVPARRHRDLFADARPPRHAADTGKVRRLHRARLQSLQAVDEANAALVRALRRTAEWKDTVVVFTSDNGFQLGEHGTLGKNEPYEESLGVPFLMTGPDIPAGRRLQTGSTLVDLAATFLSYAGVLAEVRAEGRLDGEDLRRTLASVGSEDDLRRREDTQLILGGTASKRALARYGWAWRGVRTDRYTFVRRHSGAEELYDRRVDASQRLDFVGDPAYTAVAKALRDRLQQLQDCAGVKECERTEFAPLPPPGA